MRYLIGSKERINFEAADKLVLADRGDARRLSPRLLHGAGDAGGDLGGFHDRGGALCSFSFVGTARQGNCSSPFEICF